MARKDVQTESNTNKQKILVNVGEHRKGWLEAVSECVEDGSVTEVLRCLIDGATVEDPESYARKVLKWRTKWALEEIERAERELQARKDAIIQGLERREDLVPAKGE